MAGLPLFPALPGVTWPVKRTQIFDTIVQTAVSGKETTLPKRITPRWRWELPFDMLRSDATKLELQTLSGFYASRFGRAYAFGYVDAEDRVATNQPLGAGDGVRTVFQLVRAFGGFTEPVFLPVDLPVVMVAGKALVLGADYTLSVGGLIIFVKAPAAGAAVTWTGTFAWMCRFDDDEINFSNFMKGFWSVEKLSFTSVIY